MKKGQVRISKSLASIDSSESIEKRDKAIKVNSLTAENDLLNEKTAIIQEMKTSQQGLPSGWTRATFIVKQEFSEKIKALAYWERVTVKEIIHEALTQYMQGKNIKSIPKKKIQL